MFTTTLTRVTVQPIIHPLPFGPGDIVHWPAAGDAYHCYHAVDTVYMDSTYTYGHVPHAKMWKAHDKVRDSKTYWTNPVSEFKDVRVVQSNRTGWRQGAPYNFVEREEQTETFDVEHKFTVGDVIRKPHGALFTIKAIALTNPSGTRDDGPFYIYEGEHSFDIIAWVDESGTALVGGPRFCEKVSALQALTQARDLIATPETWMKGDYRDGNRFCAIGAIQHVVKDPDDLVAARAVLASVIDPEKDDAHHVIVSFNDNDDRTHEQVLAAFDAAIANARFVELNG